MVLDGFLVSMFPWPWISSTRRVLRCHTGERAQGAADGNAMENLVENLGQRNTLPRFLEVPGLTF